MMDILEMKNIEKQKISITEDHITEIKQYLKELDLSTKICFFVYSGSKFDRVQ